MWACVPPHPSASRLAIGEDFLTLPACCIHGGLGSSGVTRAAWAVRIEEAENSGLVVDACYPALTQLRATAARHDENWRIRMAHNDELATAFFNDGTQIKGTVTIQRSAAEVFAAWSDLSGLHTLVEGVTPVNPKDGSLVTVTLGAGEAKDDNISRRVEILTLVKNERIAWRGAPDSTIAHTGTVSLRELPFNRGTVVSVIIDYIAPTGTMRQRLDKFLGRDPQVFLNLMLFRFRQLMEAGEVATTQGQPCARSESRDVAGSHDEQKFAKLEGIS
jgi:uncharacterized membrane protein